MKKSLMKKLIYILLLVVSILFIMSVKTNAASLSISTSKSTVTEGETFTVTITVSGGAGYVSASASNGTGRLNSTFLDNTSTSFSCTAGSAGTLKISASGVIADYTTEADENKSATKSITVKAEEKPVVKDPVVVEKPAEKPSNTTKPPTVTTKPVQIQKSSNNTLSELSVEEGTISPVFEKDVREYALTIPYEITELNVTATPSDTKATVAIEGNKELIEGENTVTVKVTAEDGTIANYIIKVTRKRVPIALKTLVIKYKNQEGQILELPLNPTFNFDILEYILQDLEYWVEKLSIEATANIEGATIDIQGADTLQTGENIITITVKILEQNTTEGEEPKEETITYTIKVNKTEEPTIIAKTSDWFNGIMGTVSSWFNSNKSKVILGSLVLCIVALMGLSVYIVIDYNKYKDVIAKVKKVTEINTNAEKVERIEQVASIDEEVSNNNNKEDKPKRGKHF